MKENYTQWLEDTLNSLDNMEKAEAPLYFHSRVMNRFHSLSRANSGLDSFFPVLKPKFMLGILGVVLILNTVFFVVENKKQNTPSEKSNLESFSNEFNLAPGNN